jgi:hypothetical protein
MMAVALQSVPVPSIPDTSTLALALLAFLSGAACPTYYAQERLRGAGRFVLAKMLPYRPPPGQDEQAAMIEATEPAGDEQEGDES